jgi:leucyl-tRNA synthetase
VDPADYKRLRRYEWISKKGKNSFYSLRHAHSNNKKKETLIYMHQEIIEVPHGMVIDHINHDGMDNRKANLRAATYSQNLCHRKKRSGAMYSKYKGVHWDKSRRKWVARIGFEKREIHLGYFRSEIEAAKAYDRAARKYHGEFACLNFPESGSG